MSDSTDTGPETDTDPDPDTGTGELGPRPEPRIEAGEVNPGGVDAVAESDGIEAQDEPVVARDLDPNDNPAVENALPEEMKKGEDTSTEATEGDGDVDAGESS